MSQNQGGLSEDELRDYINEKYSLRLERGVFLKPNRDVIIDIYQKFLDEFWPPWRRDPGAFQDCEDPAPIKALMVKYLRIIIKLYNNSHIFNFTDLVSPVRHRTRITLTLLVYHRERVQDLMNKWQEDKEELQMEQDEVLKKKEKLAQCKDQIEELAIAISSTKPVEELKLTIDEGDRELEIVKKKCEDIGNEAKEVKSQILRKREMLQSEMAEAEERKQEIQKLRKQLETLNNGLHIEKKIADIEQMISEEENQLNVVRANITKAKKNESLLERLISVQRLFDNEGARYFDLINECISNFAKESSARRIDLERRKNSILEHQKKEESMRTKLTNLEFNLQKLELSIKTDNEKDKIRYEASKSEIKDRERALLKEETIRHKNIEEAKKARTELKQRLDEELAQHQRYMERADRKVKLFEEHHRKSKELSEQNLAILAERRAKINALVGVVESEVTLDVPANRTYIKT